MKDLVIYIARSLADHPDQVKVKEFDEGGQVIIQLHVAEEDMGRIIGKGGKVANAIRTLVRTAAARDRQRVQLEIE
ncbi:MAG: KH domain-containing protein [Chloroflexi bacterium]|nr:KH domain-containing protein [Chloroflexota bacterium]